MRIWPVLSPGTAPLALPCTGCGAGPGGGVEATATPCRARPGPAPIGDAIAVDRRGAVRRAEAEFLKESWLLASRHVIQVIEDRVEQAVLDAPLQERRWVNDRLRTWRPSGRPRSRSTSSVVDAGRYELWFSSQVEIRWGFGERGSPMVCTPIGVLESEGRDRNS